MVIKNALEVLDGDIELTLLAGDLTREPSGRPNRRLGIHRHSPREGLGGSIEIAFSKVNPCGVQWTIVTSGLLDLGKRFCSLFELRTPREQQTDAVVVPALPSWFDGLVALLLWFDPSTIG